MGQFSEALCLKTVYELLGQRFFVPAYQRGYRWEPSQVRALLDDFWDFIQRTAQADESGFYCLQPVVVVASPDGWQVVDGQQRLTTLYLILHYLEQEHLGCALAQHYALPLYSLQYETRPDSAWFLAHIHQAQVSNHIDLHFMQQAYREIQGWFATKAAAEKQSVLDLLLAQEAAPAQVKVIWYDLSAECAQHPDYAVEVFARLNIGKIPLTNAELIRALFLRRSPQSALSEAQRLQIALEWDAIEQRLQEPAFWYFISNNTQDYATRIEFIFDLMKEKKAKDSDELFTFYCFADDFAVEVASGQLVDVMWHWAQVKGYFLRFEEWFQDKELYHLVGFLVACDVKIGELIHCAKQKTKTGFKKALQARVRRQLGAGDLNALSYGADDKVIRKVLLLFSVQSALASQEVEMRFPFDRYKLGRWDIEHIRSQTDTPPSGEKRRAWLDSMAAYFASCDLLETEQQLAQEVQRQRALEPATFPFQELYDKVMQYFDQGAEGEWLHGLGNLALLDAATNRSYGNAPFLVKRARIIKNETEGVFMPVGTKNAFLKYYSRSATQVLRWTESDAKEYLAAMAELLTPYLAPAGAAHE